MMNYSPLGNLHCVMAQFLESLEDKEGNKSTLIISWIPWRADLLHSGINRAVKADDFISPYFVVL